MAVRFSGLVLPKGKIKIGRVDSSNVVQPTYVSIDGPITHHEGTETNTNFVFIVTRSGNISNPLTLNYTVSGYGDNPASANDFEGSVFPSGSVYFAGGQTTTSFPIIVKGDSEIEEDEEFVVTITASEPNVNITTSSAIGKIINDDVPPSTTSITWAIPQGNLGTFDMESEVTIELPINDPYDKVESFSISSGELPSTMTINLEGSIVGVTPDVVGDQTYYFTVKVEDIDGFSLYGNFYFTVLDTRTYVNWITPEGTLADVPGGAELFKKLEAEVK